MLNSLPQRLKMALIQAHGLTWKRHRLFNVFRSYEMNAQHNNYAMSARFHFISSKYSVSHSLPNSALL